MADNRNTILAIVLSLIVFLGWQYFVAQPQIERQRQLAQQQQATQTTEQGQPSTAPQPVPGPGQADAPTAGAPAAGGGAVVVDREAALAATRRVAIETPRISGSINLTGGRIDDVRLKDYRETVEPDSETIVLFSPKG